MGLSSISDEYAAGKLTMEIFYANRTLAYGGGYKLRKAGNDFLNGICYTVIVIDYQEGEHHAIY